MITMKIKGLKFVAHSKADPSILEQTYSVKEVSTFTGASIQSVYNWIRKGKIRFVRNGREVRVFKDVLENVEAEPTEAVEAEPTEAVEAEPTEAVEAEPTEAVEAEPTEAVKPKRKNKKN